MYINPITYLLFVCIRDLPHLRLHNTYLCAVRQTKFNVDERKGPQIRKWDFQILHSKFPRNVSKETCFLCFSKTVRTISIAEENKSIALWKEDKQVRVTSEHVNIQLSWMKHPFSCIQEAENIKWNSPGWWWACCESSAWFSCYYPAQQESSSWTEFLLCQLSFCMCL